MRYAFRQVGKAAPGRIRDPPVILTPKIRNRQTTDMRAPARVESRRVGCCFCRSACRTGLLRTWLKSLVHSLVAAQGWAPPIADKIPVGSECREGLRRRDSVMIADKDR